MSYIITIIKGMLFYMTAFFTIFYIGAIDSIFDNGYFIQFTFVLVLLIFLCIKILSYEDIELYSGYKFFKKFNTNED